MAALDEGATVLTANARLSRRVLTAHAARRHAEGESVWRRGDVLPFGAWLRRLHENALAAGVIEAGEPATLLRPEQAEALWQQIIESRLPENGLLQTTTAARRAMDAHELACAWGLDWEEIRRAPCNEDVDAFRQWRQDWQGRLADPGWLDPARLPEAAMGWLRRAPALRPPAIHLLGFTEFTPGQRQLLDCLEGLGVAVTVIPLPETPAADRVRVACADAEAEIAAAAHWARHHLEADPGRRIGIVVRDLAERREALARHLDAVLEPAARGEPGHRRDRGWNLSLGVALADEPLVHDALGLLALAGGEVDFATASRLLRSPFLGGAESERHGRTRVELLLREQGETRLAPGRLIRLCAEPAPRLAGRLEALREAARAVPARQSPGAWAEHFAELLRIAGWPGERGLDSHEYQAEGAWRELLGCFAGMATVLGEIPRGAALSRLRQIARDQTFQPAAGVTAPVQVLGLFEALGQDFDAVWIMGLHDEVWPESPRPNPFLPLALQRERDLPHATAARERAYAEDLTRHLLAAAGEVRVSWPQREGDRELRPSPLIAELPVLDEPPPAAVADPRRSLLASGHLESLAEDYAPALPAEQAGRMRGGTGLFRDQSNCPFRAFAMHRLGAGDLESPEPGLDPRTRGEVVHRILHRLWEQFSDRAGLAALGEEGRRECIREVVADQLRRVARELPELFTPRFTRLEQERLEAVIEEWLSLELEREEFRVVGREETVRITIGPLNVGGRIDRIDELADGSRVLIDYKTGRQDRAGDWLGERPRDPQLPLYAVHQGGTIDGLAVARVHRHQAAFIGVTRAPGQLPGVRAAEEWKPVADLGWDGVVSAWREMAERLAGDIVAGHAAVDPLPDACDYCHLASLCRIHDEPDHWPDA